MRKDSFLNKLAPLENQIVKNEEESTIWPGRTALLKTGTLPTNLAYSRY
jgi:hypothetical protein